MNAEFAKLFNINANAINLSDKNSALNLNALANVSLNSADLCLANGGGGGKSCPCFSTALCFLSFVCFSLFFKRSKNSIYTQKCFQALVIANERSEVRQSTKKAMDCHEFAPLRFANAGLASKSRNDGQAKAFYSQSLARNDDTSAHFHTFKTIFHKFNAIFRPKFNAFYNFTPKFLLSKD